MVKRKVKNEQQPVSFAARLAARAATSASARSSNRTSRGDCRFTLRTSTAKRSSNSAPQRLLGGRQRARGGNPVLARHQVVGHDSTLNPYLGTGCKRFVVLVRAFNDLDSTL
jgi:hypothetical protein